MGTFRSAALKRAFAHPVATLKLFRSGAGWRRLRYAIRPPSHGRLGTSVDGVGKREYETYDDYVKHQRSKVALLDLSTYDIEFRNGLAHRLKDDGLSGLSVLCLAARIGTEVRAFHDLGAFAVGVDLEPGAGNSTVLHGDFHDLVFPDASVDLVYCNSLDHALDISRTLGEARRVLKPTGMLLLDVQDGTEDAGEFDDWAATTWSSVSQVSEAVQAAGFEVVGQQPITVPWSGSELRCTPT